MIRSEITQAYKLLFQYLVLIVVGPKAASNPKHSRSQTENSRSNYIRRQHSLQDQISRPLTEISSLGERSSTDTSCCISGLLEAVIAGVLVPAESAAWLELSLSGSPNFARTTGCLRDNCCKNIMQCVITKALNFSTKTFKNHKCSKAIKNRKKKKRKDTKRTY